MSPQLHDDDASSHASSSSSSSGVGVVSFLLYDLPSTVSRCARVGSRVAFAVSPVAAYLPQYLTLKEQAKELVIARHRHARHAAAVDGNVAIIGNTNNGNNNISGGSGAEGVIMRQTGSRANLTGTGMARESSSGGMGGAFGKRGAHGSTLDVSLTPGGGSISPYSTPKKMRCKPPPAMSACSPSSNDTLRLPLTVSNGAGYDDNGAKAKAKANGEGWFSTSAAAPAAANMTSGDKAAAMAGEDRCGGGGMSPLSVLILLSSHLLRLLYFHGQVQKSARRRRSLSARAIYKQETSGEDLPYDLVIQSVVMIAVQLLLVKAMAQCRRIRTKRSLDDHNHSSFDAPGLRPATSADETKIKRSCPPSSWADDLSSLVNRHPITGSVFRLVLSLIRKLVHLLHPARIWNYPTFREHLQFLSLISLTTFLHAEYVLFTSEDDGESGVRLIRNASVLLESCLALPQLAQNYLRKDTAGLSLIMVGGWIAGDFLKLLYFLLQMRGGGSDAGAAPVVVAAAAVAATASDETAGKEGEGVSDERDDGTMTAFAAGCVLALSLDLMVALQMLLWYPTPDVVMVRDAVRNAVTRHRQKGGSRVAAGKRAVLAEIIRILMGSTGTGTGTGGTGGNATAVQEMGTGAAAGKMGANLGHPQPQRSSMLSVPTVMPMPMPTMLLRPNHSE